MSTQWPPRSATELRNRIVELKAENELLRSDLEAEVKDADAAVDSVVAKVKWYHAELEEKDVTIKALRFLLAWKPRAQRVERSET